MDIKPVGYHAWVDADKVALFVLGQPNALQLASVKTGKGEVAANGIGRSLHRIPGTRMVSFVHREPSGEFWIEQIDMDSRNIEPLTKVVEGNNERDMAWMPDGKTIVMSGGTKVYSWTRGASGWTEVFDAAPHSLGAVSRLAVSTKGDAIAIVVAEPKKLRVGSIFCTSDMGWEGRSGASRAALAKRRRQLEPSKELR